MIFLKIPFFRVTLEGIITYRTIYKQAYGATVSKRRDSVVQGG